MPKVAKYLLVASGEAYSGKSATILGLSHQLQERGLGIAYGKPVGTCLRVSEGTLIEEDVQFIQNSLNLTEQHILPMMVALDENTVHKRLQGDDNTDYQQALAQEYLHSSPSDLVLLEAPGTLDEGSLFNLSLPQVATILDGKVLFVVRYKSLLSIDEIIAAQARVGDRLVGVVINDIPVQHLSTVNETMRPFLEARGIAVLGMLPRSDLMRSVSVGELVKQLNAEVLCRSDRLDLMVESLAIGAMNVNAAVKYFRKRRNMAVVTGGDRIEIQQAALETSTQCLILTGQLPPPDFIRNRAEELEIPILSVDLDTLTTVEIVDRAFGQVRVHEAIKVEYMRHLISEVFDCDRLLEKLGLNPVAIS